MYACQWVHPKNPMCSATHHFLPASWSAAARNLLGVAPPRSTIHLYLKSRVVIYRGRIYPQYLLGIFFHDQFIAWRLNNNATASVDTVYFLELEEMEARWAQTHPNYRRWWL
jgi:hypothetical protein